MTEPTYKFNRQTQEVHRRRYIKRRRLAIMAIIIVIILIIALLINLAHLNEGDKPQIGANYTKQIAGPKLFKSTYFQFSDNASWQYAPNDSTPSKITYLLFESGVPAHSVMVYVNQVPLQDDLATTHVLPVAIDNQNSFTVNNISDVCGNLYKPTDLKRIKMVALDSTNMLCVPDSPQYSSEVGQIGGNYDLALKRNNGQVAHYIIIYRNLTINPDPAPFIRIMKSFKAL